MVSRFARRLALVPALALALAALGPVPVSAGGADATYPTDCPGNLQACIDAAGPGDVVEIAANDNIGGVVTIFNQSLTLRPAAGFHPSVDRLSILANTGDVTVTVTDLTVNNDVRGRFTGGSGHSLTLRRLEVLGTGHDMIYLNSSVPASFELTESSSASTNHQTPAVLMHAEHSSGIVTFRLVGNRATGHGNSDAGPGIRLAADGAGNTVADIYNNVVWDAAGSMAGAAASLNIGASATAGNVFVNAVGNTLDHSHGIGIAVVSSLPDGKKLNLDLFNNVITNSGLMGMYINSDPDTLDIRDAHNDFFANQPNNLGAFSLGPDNLAVAPKYVDAATGNLRLKSTSALLNQGEVCSLGGVANPDAGGRHRLFGDSVDIGAYERSAGPVTGVVREGSAHNESLDGTNGADILCGYGGRDVMRGFDGADFMDAGKGNDLLYPGLGADRAYGRGGTDTFCAKDLVQGNDLIDGGPQTDSGKADPGDTKVSIEQAATTCST